MTQQNLYRGHVPAITAKEPELMSPSFETHKRLALKAIALAAEYGEEMTMEAAFERTADNWYTVVAWDSALDTMRLLEV